MEDYELTINAIGFYKNKACEIVSDNCSKCEAMHEYNNRHYCAFDTVVRFIEWVNKYNR